MKVLTDISIKKENWKDLLGRKFSTNIVDYILNEEDVFAVYENGKHLLVKGEVFSLYVEGKNTITYYDLKSSVDIEHLISSSLYNVVYQKVVPPTIPEFDINTLETVVYENIHAVDFDGAFHIDTDDFEYFGFTKEEVAYLPLVTNKAGTFTLAKVDIKVLKEVYMFEFDIKEFEKEELCRFENSSVIDKEKKEVKILRYGLEDIVLNRKDIYQIREVLDDTIVFKTSDKAYLVRKYDIGTLIHTMKEVSYDYSEGSIFYEKKILPKSKLSRSTTDAFGFLKL